MKDLIKKTLLSGIGLTLMTGEKVKKIGEEIIKQADFTEKEGNKFIKDLLKESKTRQTQLEKLIKDTVNSVLETALKKLKIPSRAEIKALEKRIDKLEKALTATKKSGSKTAKKTTKTQTKNSVK